MEGIVDREFQRELLTTLAKSYPNRVDLAPTPKQSRNLVYLAEHGLVDNTQTKPLGGGIDVHASAITAKGLDFLANDGGLSAILGVVEVKPTP